MAERTEQTFASRTEVEALRREVAELRRNLAQRKSVTNESSGDRFLLRTIGYSSLTVAIALAFAVLVNWLAGGF